MRYDVHLVGSVPLRDATDVFENVAAVLGPCLLRIPDGETGERAGWMGWLDPVFRTHPDFEPSEETFRPHAAGRETTRFRLKERARAEHLEFQNLRHADVAIESYRSFAALKKAGKIPAHCRYQFAFAHPISVANHYAVSPIQEMVEEAYERAVLRDIDKMLVTIPADQLAIQWDVASAVFASLQLATPTRHGTTREQMLKTYCASCVRIGNAVPTGVELLYHLCYGDSGHRHALEPTDMADMVEFASLLSRDINRPIDLFHMPVPRNRDDDSYFEPLGKLTIQAKTRVSLGLIHLTDGSAGTTRRIATAEKHLSGFLIATECGFGRRPPESVPALLHLHAEMAGLRGDRIGASMQPA